MLVCLFVDIVIMNFTCTYVDWLVIGTIGYSRRFVEVRYLG